MSAKVNKFNSKRAFTLLELMVVLVIIGILIASVFKLFSAVSENSKTAQTKARMERLQNAISGFYSSYGTYPPVPLYANPDPMNASDDRGAQGGEKIPWSGGQKTAAARWAARAQPVSFEYPYPQTYDEFVNEKFRDQQIRTVNEVYNNAATIPNAMWEEVKMFKFGLLSFLLPRVELVGIPPETSAFSRDQPIEGFYHSKQWGLHNKSSRIGAGNKDKLRNALKGQRELEMRECAKWLPNLEGILSGHAPTIMNTVLQGGGDVQDSMGGSHQFRGAYSKDGQKTILFCTTVVDGWGNDFFYYSAPPYQSYRIWSAGSDGNTFPPWIPLESLSSDDLKLVSGWTKDDIVGFDR
ncbi:MAG: type II secretion system protein [Kiritimatiellae bacterium]|nr:type II secretion system protein [Kiritimatiellia bacterium]